jgi:hypothetical protein
MSRQSKQARNAKQAKQFSEQRKNGGKGPKRTEPKHGKDPARRLAHNNASRQGSKVKFEE